MTTGVEKIDAGALGQRRVRYFDLVMAAFVTILLLSNVLGAGKVAVLAIPGLGEWPFGAGILFFPVSYVIGDILTEVYGYAHARRCIWAGFSALLEQVLPLRYRWRAVGIRLSTRARPWGSPASARVR